MNIPHPVPLRPHHGMCLAFFLGKGYSEGFAAHMGAVKESLQSETPVRLTVGTDVICTACPHNNGATCDTKDLVAAYDRAVLSLCGLSEGQTISFGKFRSLVESQILSAGKRRDICGGCEWNGLCGG